MATSDPVPPMDMNRRQAVIRMALLMGAAVVGPRLLAADFGKTGGTPLGSKALDIALLDEIGETIIPATDIPGAKAVRIGEFIAVMVADCMRPREQKAFNEGLAQLTANYEQRFGVSFVAGKPADRITFLNELNKELRTQRKTSEEADASADHGVAAQGTAVRCFRTLKQLTILGYFTSEVGCTQALRFEEVPGRFDGSAEYRPGDHNWFTEVRG